ncbi:MAG: transcriptional repressor [Spirochaetia bacterium]|nr:transcriptional repressor [Spirochaetia bacterium]
MATRYASRCYGSVNFGGSILIALNNKNGKKEEEKGSSFMTKARKAILEILQKKKVPQSALDIFSSVEDEMNQVTVYRTLHYLESKGYVDSFVLHCTQKGTERYYVALLDPLGNSCEHHHWFHCEICHQFTDLGSCQIDSLIDLYNKEHNITILHHNLSLSGICQTCQQKGGSEEYLGHHRQCL